MIFTLRADRGWNSGASALKFDLKIISLMKIKEDEVLTYILGVTETWGDGLFTSRVEGVEAVDVTCSESDLAVC